MSRSGNVRRGTRRRRAPASRSPAPLRRPAALSPLEQRVLALAREVATIARTADDPRTRRDRALARLAEAFESDGPLAELLVAAWRRARTDESLTLSLAWGREQLRASLHEILEAGAAAGVMRKEPTPAELAWIVLAACEAVSREAPGGGIITTADLLRALARLTEP
jgi:hypothetical protein